MAKKVIAPVNPALLKWARESFNLPLEEAAKKVSVQEERLREWERGENRPTFKQLMKLSRAYKRPVDIFYLSEPPLADEPFSKKEIEDFRKIKETEYLQRSPQLILELRKANFRRESFIELSELLQEKIVDFTLRKKEGESARTLADRIRRVLAVPLKQQFKWKQPNEAYRQWRRAIEQLQIFVFQTGAYMYKRKVRLEELRGMAISLNPLPIIVVNGNDHPRPRIFTLFHELGHILLNQSAMRNIHSVNNDQNEQFCNQFAGCLLVPEYALREQLGVTELNLPREWSDEDIRKMANRFSVSKEVIARRLMDCHLATPNFYMRKRREYQHHTSSTTFGRAPYYRRIINQNGERYIRKVLEAYHDSCITFLDVAIYLDTKVKHIEPIQSELGMPPLD